MPERGEPYYFLYIYDNTMNLLKHIVNFTNAFVYENLKIPEGSEAVNLRFQRGNQKALSVPGEGSSRKAACALN
jgi:hypothetical protein